MTAQLDLFATSAPTRARTARITCRVCGRQAVAVPVEQAALLCPTCLADVPASRAHVAACTASALAQLERATEAWQQALAASPAQARWAGVQAALTAVAEGNMPQATFDHAWAVRRAEGGALAALLDAYTTYTVACDAAAETLRRLWRAQQELNNVE